MVSPALPLPYELFQPIAMLLTGKPSGSGVLAVLVDAYCHVCRTGVGRSMVVKYRSRRVNARSCALKQDCQMEMDLPAIHGRSNADAAR